MSVDKQLTVQTNPLRRFMRLRPIRITTSRVATNPSATVRKINNQPAAAAVCDSVVTATPTSKRRIAMASVNSFTVSGIFIYYDCDLNIINILPRTI